MKLRAIIWAFVAGAVWLAVVVARQFAVRKTANAHGDDSDVRGAALSGPPGRG